MLLRRSSQGACLRGRPLTTLREREASMPELRSATSGCPPTGPGGTPRGQLTRTGRKGRGDRPDHFPDHTADMRSMLQKGRSEDAIQHVMRAYRPALAAFFNGSSYRRRFADY